MIKKTGLPPEELFHTLARYESELKELGIDYVSIGLIGGDGHHTAKMGDATWERQYIEQRAIERDPIVFSVIENPALPVYFKDLGSGAVNVARHQILKLSGGFCLCNLYPSFVSLFPLGFRGDVNPEQFFKENEKMIRFYHIMYDRFLMDWHLRLLDEEEKTLPLLDAKSLSAPKEERPALLV